ncbi:hypothetical protein TK45_12765 [Bowmanella sp. JS7-9]|nr:hypothetical protein TK45_12765 [Bowmanella sp. JS7-9]
MFTIFSAITAEFAVNERIRTKNMNKWRKWHKWIGLFVGIQVMLWISGGVVMSIIPIDMVRGQHLITRPALPETLPALPQNLSQLNIITMRWLLRDQEPILEVQTRQGRTIWFDQQGRGLHPLTSTELSHIVQSQYIGAGDSTTLTQLGEVPREVGGLALPLYRADFNDAIHTSFYLNPISGQVLSVRSDLWRVYDFFWMLHILDFEEREDFNNPLLITLALAAWLFVFTGFVLLYHAIIKPNYRKWQRR